MLCIPNIKFVLNWNHIRFPCRFTEILTLKKASTFRSNLYPQLVQVTFNNNHLLAIVVDQLLKEDNTFLISSWKHIQNLLCYGINLKGDQRWGSSLREDLFLFYIEVFLQSGTWIVPGHIQQWFGVVCYSWFSNLACILINLWRIRNRVLIKITIPI